MSHNVAFYEYSFSTPKVDIERELSAHVRCECWQEGGNMKPIRWLDEKVCDSREAAEDLCRTMSKDYTDCVAVPYRVADVNDNKLRDLMRARSAAYKAYKDANACIAAQSLKSQYIGCKKCGSKLNRDFIKSNFCPLCGEDMRSKTQLLHVVRLKQKVDVAELTVSKCELALAKKSKKLMWLVKIGYHT